MDDTGSLRNDSQAPRPEQPLPAEKRILVIDDEQALRNLVARVLSADGHRVDQAEDAEVGWRLLQRRSYDHILLDLVMPGTSGQELYQRIRQSDIRLANRTIFMTGTADSPEVRRFLEATGNPVLGKPFGLDELRRVILESQELTPDSG